MSIVQRQQSAGDTSWITAKNQYLHSKERSYQATKYVGSKDPRISYLAQRKLANSFLNYGKCIIFIFNMYKKLVEQREMLRHSLARSVARRPMTRLPMSDVRILFYIGSDRVEILVTATGVYRQHFTVRTFFSLAPCLPQHYPFFFMCNMHMAQGRAKAQELKAQVCDVVCVRLIKTLSSASHVIDW